MEMLEYDDIPTRVTGWRAPQDLRTSEDQTSRVTMTVTRDADILFSSFERSLMAARDARSIPVCRDSITFDESHWVEAIRLGKMPASARMSVRILYPELLAFVVNPPAQKKRRTA